MNDSNALGPQVRVLFDTIQKQAVSYNEALRNIENSAREYTHLITEINNYVDDVKKNYERFINEKGEVIDLTISKIVKEQHRINDKYDKLSNLDEVKNKHILLINELEDKLEVFNNSILEIKSEIKDFKKTVLHYRDKAQDEIEKFISDNRASIQSEVKRHTDEIENNINFQQRIITGKYNIFENALRDLQNEITSKFSTLREILDNLNKKQMANSAEDIALENRDLIEQIDLRLAEIFRQIDSLKKLKPREEEDKKETNRDYEKEVVYELTGMRLEEKESVPSTKTVIKQEKVDSSKIDELEKKLKMQSIINIVIFVLLVLAIIIAVV